MFVNSTADLWGLVNNAGIGHVLPLEWTPLSIFKSTADVNLWGMIDVTTTFLPLVKKARGRVVNFSSVAGRENDCIIWFPDFSQEKIRRSLVVSLFTCFTRKNIQNLAACKTQGCD